MSKNVFIFDHPLIQHKVAILRDKTTGRKEFRELLNEVALLMGYEATRDLPTVDIDVETPLGTAKAKKIAGNICIVTILRAGLGMVESGLRLMPTAKVGHIGIYRDEHQRPVQYYCKFPNDIAGCEVLLLDPMLATGGSASAAITLIKDAGVPGKSIRLLSLLAAAAGIEQVNDEHSDVRVFAAAKDDELNEHGYIIPGLGDAGDRLYGTK